MFNPNAKTPALAACTYVIEEVVLPSFLPGAIFTDVSLSLEVWDMGNQDIYIEEICFTQGREYKIFKQGDWMFDGFVKAIYADDKWNEILLEACRDAA